MPSTLEKTRADSEVAACEAADFRAAARPAAPEATLALTLTFWKA